MTDEGHVMEGSSNRIVRRVDLALCDRYNYINFSGRVSTQLSIVQYIATYSSPQSAHCDCDALL